MFKNLANLGNLMRQAQNMGEKLDEIKGRLQAMTVRANAGGGMVEVEMNGLGQMTKLVIEPQMVENNEREMLEDLIPAAVNEAITKAKELHAEEVKSLTQGLDIPGIDDAIAKFTG